MGTQARSIPTSQWQFKAGFTTDKPDVSEEDEPSEELWDDQSFEEYYSSQESEEKSTPSDLRMKRMMWTTQIYMSQDQEGSQDHQRD
jgi:hypothetical protein